MTTMPHIRLSAADASGLTARAWARLDSGRDGTIILWTDERTGDDQFEAELTEGAGARAWARLDEDEDNNLVLVVVENDDDLYDYNGG